MRIWEWTDYRQYLFARLGAEGSRTGQRKALADFIPVHTSFVSQVLKGRADFSLEQAEAINHFLKHTEDEGQYFILLLLMERAGSQALRQRFFRQIEEMRSQRLDIKSRLEAEGEISLKDREKFYSSAHYGAIHVLTSIPGLQTVQALAEVLRLDQNQVQEMVDFLLELGVLQLEKGFLKPGSHHVHLGTETELVLKHHSNWRLHTLQRLQFLNKEDLHYSACVSLSKADAFKVKEALLQCLKEQVQTISSSQEEVAYVLSFDFYPL